MNFWFAKRAKKPVDPRALKNDTMKILTGSQIREADQYTIEHEPIESLALMERASEVIAQWICNNIPQEQP